VIKNSALLLAIALAAARPVASATPCVPAGGAQSDGGGVVVVPISGELSEEMTALTVRAIRKAHELDAHTLVFEIDTVGGDAELMDRLITEIDRADELHLRTVAFVTQKAASAGALVAISCERLYLKPGSNIGSALVLMQPQVFGVPIGAPHTIESDQLSPLDRKIVGHFRTHFASKAQARQRPAALAAAMVYADSAVYEVEVAGQRKFDDESTLENDVREHGESGVRRIREVCKKGAVLNLTAQEAQETGLADGLATSRQDLLEQLGLGSAPVLAIEPSWSEHLVDFTQHYGWLLLVVGLVAVFVEVKVPGFGLPGITGALLLGLWLFGKYLAGLAEVTDVLLIVVGFGLLAMEVFVIPGSMLCGILGVVGIVAGIVLASQQTFLPPSSPYAQVEWWSNLRSLALSFVGGVAAMVAVAYFFPSIPLLNRAILRAGPSGAAVSVGDEVAGTARSIAPRAGMRGVASTVLRPSGKVAIEGVELDAVTEGSFVDAGRPIVVVRVESSRLVVRGDGPSA
jgi:membrane-bound serine protease (ClpP class)